MVRKLRALEADIVIVDVGAGVGDDVLDFFDLVSLDDTRPTGW